MELSFTAVQKNLKSIHMGLQIMCFLWRYFFWGGEGVGGRQVERQMQRSRSPLHIHTDSPYGLHCSGRGWGSTWSWDLNPNWPWWVPGNKCQSHHCTLPPRVSISRQLESGAGAGYWTQVLQRWKIGRSTSVSPLSPTATSPWIFGRTLALFHPLPFKSTKIWDYVWGQ